MNFLRFLFVLFFMLSNFLCFDSRGAQDTLVMIGEKTRRDTTETVRILRTFSWTARVRTSDGGVSTYEGSRVDTFLRRRDIDTVRLSTEVVVTDSLMNRLLYMQYEVGGSLLGKIDGEVFANTGIYGDSRKSRMSNRKDYAGFIFRDSIAHFEIIYIPDRAHHFDLNLELVRKGAAEEEISEKLEDDKSSLARGFYYLAFSIVFMTMFAYFRSKKEHLYFAMFCFFISGSYLWDHIHSDFLKDVHLFIVILAFEFLAIFFCKIMLNKERSKVPLIIIGVLLLLAFIPQLRFLMAHNSTKGRMPLYALFAFPILISYTFLSSFVYLIKGIGQKSWEARAILVTCLLPLVAYALLLIGIVIFAAIDIRAVASNEFIQSLINAFLTAIVFAYPLAPVFILARRNALNQRQLADQLLSIQHLSDENAAKEKEKKDILERQNELLEREVEERTAEIVDQKEKIEKQHDELKIEKEKSDDLLRNILPAEVAEELKQTGSAAARHFENVTVLFADFVNFTTTGSELTPQELVHELDVCFRAFDQIMVERGIEKIKTIGDAYLAVCGLPVADVDHALKVMDAAKAILRFMEERSKDPVNRMVKVRIGLHTGSVVAGIVGVKKFAYDIWGDTVNTAARMQQASDPGKINISQATFEQVKGNYSCTARGYMDVKGKGAMEMYFVD